MCDTEQIFYGALFTLEFYVFNQLFVDLSHTVDFTYQRLHWHT